MHVPKPQRFSKPLRFDYEYRKNIMYKYFWMLLPLLANADDTLIQPPINAETQYELGMRYARGVEDQRDDVRAKQLLESAAKQDHSKAIYALGWLYYSGRGVKVDYHKAVELFRRAARNDLPEAQYMLGIMYGQGKGITRNGSLSLYWIKQAAKKGHIAAQKMVGKLFSMSIPPPVNP